MVISVFNGEPVFFCGDVLMRDSVSATEEINKIAHVSSHCDSCESCRSGG